MSEERIPTAESGPAPQDADAPALEPAELGRDRTEPVTAALPLGRAGTALPHRGSTAIDPAGRPAGTEGQARTAPPREDGAGVRPAVPPRPSRYDPRPQSAARPATRRRARLAVTRVDPWSVFVLSLLVSLFLGVVLIVAVFVLYGLLTSLGVLDSINSFAQDLQIIDAGTSVVTRGQVLAVAAVLAAVDVILLTVLATLAAFLYNLCASLTGGIEIALSERD